MRKLTHRLQVNPWRRTRSQQFGSIVQGLVCEERWKDTDVVFVVIPNQNDEVCIDHESRSHSRRAPQPSEIRKCI